MKIYTRKGDTGETSLIGGTRVPKSHLRIEAYGTVDELNSFLGLVCYGQKGKPEEAVLTSIQEKLFVIGSWLASDPAASRMKLPEITGADVEILEKEIDKMEEGLVSLKTFILPSGPEQAAWCHISRCVCRRAERLAVALSHEQEVAPVILQYLNRLSDYLFVLARKLSADGGITEKPWIP